MTPKPQANRLEEIRDSHTMKLVPMSQRELFWSELEPKIQALITEARIDGAVMGAKFGNAAFRQQSIAKPGERINLDTVLDSGIKQAKEWAERNVE